MIRRPPRSTLSSSSAASDVYKRQSQHRSTGFRPDMQAQMGQSQRQVRHPNSDWILPAWPEQPWTRHCRSGQAASDRSSKWKTNDFRPDIQAQIQIGKHQTGYPSPDGTSQPQAGLSHNSQDQTRQPRTSCSRWARHTTMDQKISRHAATEKTPSDETSKLKLGRHSLRPDIQCRLDLLTQTRQPTVRHPSSDLTASSVGGTAKDRASRPRLDSHSVSWDAA